ncbi:mini-chromosome maintenance complex-binding protein [Trichogramma pretiosum]|uniref:mini-chromosome maintenance complex-binding protein n=1 Tax=Trichogramma pretiosum TaxID=7493 RepID=UPI0006C946B7|nr:mini-chromosome maintenance complex-binding protein [Trichogramma pretiosum]
MKINPKDWTIEYFLSNESECEKILENIDTLFEIPSLNNGSLDNFKNGQLVRFQGMIQDMRNPEFFFKKYKITNKKTGENTTKSGMYSDEAKCEMNENILFDDESNENAERQTWIVVSIPGLNDWAKDKHTYSSSQVIDEPMAISKSIKRPLEEAFESMDCSDSVKKKEKKHENTEGAGPSHSTEIDIKNETAKLVSKDHLLNMPIPSKDGKACIVKVYNDSSYKLNQVIHIVGFLSLDPDLSSVNDDEGMLDIERQTLHPPATIVPRLHAIKIVDEINKFIVNPVHILPKAEKIRGDLKILLSPLLFGDEVAADYLICHLISSVYVRKECMCLGTYPINISHFPEQFMNFKQDFYDILKEILIKSHLFEITLESLNDTSLIPKKDYDCNRLTSGLLQLSKNTHLILDETNLTTGEITATGRQNYNAINEIMQFQRLAYDFKFYNMEYDTDIPILILSDVKSFIPCHIQIKLQPDPDTVKCYPQVLEAAKQYLKDENKLSDIRQYVNSLKNVQFEFSEDTVKLIQEDFVEMRQANKNISANDLNWLMVLSRLMSISHGHNALKPELWKRSKQMEKERLSRLSKHP